MGYLNKTTGAYLTRENELTQGVESTKAYVQMEIPSGTALQWFTSNDGGLTWETMTIQATRPIDENWTEYTLVCTFTDNTGNKVRYKAEMTGTPLIYPRIHSPFAGCAPEPRGHAMIVQRKGGLTEFISSPQERATA